MEASETSIQCQAHLAQAKNALQPEILTLVDILYNQYGFIDSPSVQGSAAVDDQPPSHTRLFKVLASSHSNIIPAPPTIVLTSTDGTTCFVTTMPGLP